MGYLGETENIVIEEKVNEHSPYYEYFQDKILDDDQVVQFKINEIDPSGNDTHLLGNIVEYVRRGLNADIKFCSAGVHLEGKNKIPHYHLHIITDRSVKKPQNPSDHRKRFIAKMHKLGDEEYSMGDVSMKWASVDTQAPKYNILAYPLKEGREVRNEEGKLKRQYYIDMYKPMTNEMLKFLKDIGKAIYEHNKALHFRNDLCEERKKHKLMELYDLVKHQHFDNYKDMLIWLEDNYIGKLELDKLPDFRNYKSNCEKVAVKLGILKYYNLF